MHTDAASNLRRNITALLASHKMSQNQFAQLSGVPSSSLNRLLNTSASEMSPTLATVEAIAKGFGVDPIELLQGEAQPAPQVPPRILAKQLSRLIDDFLSCDAEARTRILRLAEQESGTTTPRMGAPRKIKSEAETASLNPAATQDRQVTTGSIDLDGTSSADKRVPVDQTGVEHIAARRRS